ncbi:hypothetical protein J6590_048204 [Homalodisca vitripennis]|nr:hypothetical protein J6590_048204 [Homalodisca vitripennis]
MQGLETETDLSAQVGTWLVQSYSGTAQDLHSNTGVWRWLAARSSCISHEFGPRVWAIAVSFTFWTFTVRGRGTHQIAFR